MNVVEKKSIPIIKTGYWGFTPEYTVLYGDLNRAVRDVFLTFDEETQHALTFAPNDDSAMGRLHFWENSLRPVITEEQFSAAIMAFSRLYFIHREKAREHFLRKQMSEICLQK